MTDEKDQNGDHNGGGGFRLDPFPTQGAESPFPPLYESLPPPAPQDPPSDWIATADAHDLPTAPEPVIARANPLLALSRFAFPPAPPLDDEGLAARELRWTSRAVVVAAVFLLVFNPVSPLNWSHQQAPGWVSETVGKLSETWVGQLAQVGTDLPRQGMRDLWFDLKDARFPGQEPAPARVDTP